MAVSFFEEERRERASPLCLFPEDTCSEISAPNPGIDIHCPDESPQSEREKEDRKDMSQIDLRNGLQRLGLLPVVIIVPTAYAAIYHFYLAYYLFEWMASGAKAVPGVRMFAILFILNGLGYLALVSALYLPALQHLRRITGFLLIGYTALTMSLWCIFGNRSAADLMVYSVNIVEGVLIVLLLVKSWQERQSRRHAA